MRGTGTFATDTTSNVSSHPDNRVGMRGPGAFAPNPTTNVSNHPDNRAGARGPGSIPTTIVATASADSFDWSDAMIGGLGGVGAALLLTGCFFLLTSQRNKARLA